jgi:hypothetical protein
VDGTTRRFAAGKVEGPSGCVEKFARKPISAIHHLANLTLRKQEIPYVNQEVGDFSGRTV